MACSHMLMRRFYGANLVKINTKNCFLCHATNRVYQEGSIMYSEEKGEPTTLNLKISEEKGPYKPKRKYPGFRKNLDYYFSEFTDYTGIHGFRYMGERERHAVEKFVWLVFFCISIYFCAVLIIETWVKWDTSPVLVSFARSPTPVWQVPFPAVTVCSETKARQREYNFTEMYHKWFSKDNMTEEELQKFSEVSLVCDDHLFHEGEKITNLDSIEFLMSIAPQFGEMFMSCKWTSKNETCENFFVPIMTEEGLCYTFNMLDKTELLTNRAYIHGQYMSHNRHSEGWTLENGYPATSGKDTFPRRAMSAGVQAGFYLLMRAYQQDLDYICKGPVQGFKILLHHPAEVPRVGMQYFRAPLNQEVVVAMKPDMMTTSEGLRGYDPHRRQCFFPSERHLYFYKSYTQQNCQMECLANYTLAKCGCVAYHMPHEEGTPICGSASIICMFEAKDEVLTRDVTAGLSKDDKDPKTENFALNEDCDCLPSCTSLTYNAETSQADFNWLKVFEAFKANLSEMPGVQMTRITLFFKEQQFITSERNELYGQTDFLANCGGLLGLFTGFSFLSIVEILHFLSLRMICNVKKFGRRYWSGADKLVNNDAYFHNN